MYNLSSFFFIFSIYENKLTTTGGFYNVSVDENGLVKVEATDKEGKMTKEQQAPVVRSVPTKAD